ncbi:MAG: nucleotidyl transferase AbiEii/AbiGii toxin family protein [Pseudomonadota bacterium]
MLKINPARPLDPIALTILLAVKRATQESGIATMIVGATARDILLTHVFNLPVQRATVDIDFAIAVKDWAQFNQLKNTLAQMDGFYASEKLSHRLYYGEKNSEYENGYPFDLLPFGNVEQADHTIAWPPDMAVMMNVTGYEEVLEASEEVEMAPGQIIHVASLAGLVILKFFAWLDRGRENAKDAKDIVQIMLNYARAGNIDRLYDDGMDMLANVGHDPDLAGIQLLGRDVAQLAKPETATKLLSILNDASLVDRLEINMLGISSDQANDQQKIRQILTNFRIGMEMPVRG